MAALASTDVTVTVNAGDREIAGGGAFKNLTLASVVFGDGSLTYPTGGVPMPAIGKFGLHKAVNFAAIMDDPGNGFVYKYDVTNHKIKIYTQGFLTGATVVGAAETGALVKDSAGNEATAPRMPKTAASSTYDMGPLIELPATIAPAATTLKLLVIGE
jgi:hypothetical protein